MIEQVLHQRAKTLVRWLRLEPAEATRWHTDLSSRATIVLHGSLLEIEYLDGDAVDRVEVNPGQVDWDEPALKPHRAVNAGADAYEEIAVFFLDQPGQDPQPSAE